MPSDIHGDIIVPTVVAALELDDLFPPGIGAGQTEGMVGRLRATAAEGHLIGAGDRVYEQLGHLDLQLQHAGTDEIEVFSRLRNRGSDGGRAMTENIGAEGAVIVGVAVAVRVI
jgi:hypothetical protein